MNKNHQLISKYGYLMRDLYEYAKKNLQFEDDCKLSFLENKKNSTEPLGKTAYYDTQQKKIYIYVTGRHIKDILRSLTHELVHHTQNCRGDFIEIEKDSISLTSEGYAQKNSILREAEREAYEAGNLIFRDWEDSMKANIKGVKNG